MHHSQKKPRSWFTRLYRKLHLDYHQPPWMTGVAAAMSPERARQQARMLKRAGIEAVDIFAHDHYGHAFYPSKVDQPHPGLATDYTGTMTRALQAEKIRVLFYVNAMTHVRRPDEHPDWFVRGPDGKPCPGGWLMRDGSLACASSPHLKEYVLPLLREVVQRYHPDSIWIDAFTWTVDVLCHCDFCKSGFRAFANAELPAKEPAAGCKDEAEWQRWFQYRVFRRHQIVEGIKAMAAAVREVDPNCLFADNGAGHYNRAFPLVTNGKLDRWLAPREFGVDFLSCDPVPSGGNHEMVLSLHGRYQFPTGVPFDFANERFHCWGEWQFRHPTDWKLECATILAHGGHCFFSDQPYSDGTLEPAVYEALKDVYAFVREREPLVRDALPFTDVALLASGPSQLFNPATAWRLMVQTSQPGPNDSVQGAHLACVEAGVGFWMYDEPTLRETVPDHTTVLVAHQCLLEDATIAALQEFVRDGGSLIVTGRSGERDEKFRRRARWPWTELLGVEPVPEGGGLDTAILPSPIHYWRLRESLRPLSPLLGSDLPIQVWGDALRVRPTTARVLAEFSEPLDAAWRDGVRRRDHFQQYTVLGSCPPQHETRGPSITLNQFGKGRALYFHADPFAAYWLDGNWMLRTLFERCLDLVAPQRRLIVTKPLHVEVSALQQGRRVVLHFLNYFAQKRGGNMVHNEQLPAVRDIRVRLRISPKPRSIRCQPDDRPLAFRYRDGVLEFRLPELHIHSAAVIQL